MPQSQQIYAWIKQLASDDETQRQAAEKAITTLGADAVPFLRSARGRSGCPKVEALRLLGVVGDDCTGRTKKIIVETMENVMKSRSESIAPEEKAIAQAALERWGREVPQPKPPKVLKCNTCGRSSPQVSVRGCFLESCGKAVCKDHAAIIEGGMGTWFCSEEHKHIAMMNPSSLM